MAKSRLCNRRAFAVAILYMATLNSAQTSTEATIESGALTVAHARQPHMPAVMSSLAGYFTVHNPSAQRVVIVGLSSPNFESVAMHRSVLKHSSVSMEPVTSLEIAPGETVRFAPHGLHVMLHKSKFAMDVGDHYPVVLQLDDGRRQTFSMHVVGHECDQCGATQKQTSHHHHHDY